MTTRWVMEGSGEWLISHERAGVRTAKVALVLRSGVSMVAMIARDVEAKPRGTTASTWWVHVPKKCSEQRVPTVADAVMALAARGIAAPTDDQIADLETWDPGPPI